MTQPAHGDSHASCDGSCSWAGSQAHAWVCGARSPCTRPTPVPSRAAAPLWRRATHCRWSPAPRPCSPRPLARLDDVVAALQGDPLMQMTIGVLEVCTATYAGIGCLRDLASTSCGGQQGMPETKKQTVADPSIRLQQGPRNTGSTEAASPDALAALRGSWRRTHPNSSEPLPEA